MFKASFFFFGLKKKKIEKKNQKVPVCVLKRMEITREQPYNLIC